MNSDYKVLAQLATFATTNTDLYTTPTETQTVVSTLVIANRSATTAGSYRIAVVPSGSSLGNEHYIAYDVTLDAKDSAMLSIGITLMAGDKIIVYSSSDFFSFSVFGVEFS